MKYLIWILFIATLTSIFLGLSIPDSSTVDLLEKEYAQISGTNHAIGVGSGTDAIFLSLKALGVGVGDGVSRLKNGNDPSDIESFQPLDLVICLPDRCIFLWGELFYFALSSERIIKNKSFKLYFGELKKVEGIFY